MFGCGFCLVAMVCELYGTSYLLPAAQCDFQMSAQEKGLLNSISLIGVISSSHLWGYLADTKGRRKILMVTLAMDAVCAVISCFAPTFYIYLVVRYFCGFFVCGPSAIVYAYIGEFHAAPTRARAIVFVSVVVSIASIGQPGLAWLVIPQPWSFQLAWFTFNSWRVFVFLCAVPSILTCLFLFFFLPESPKYYLVKGREEEALAILRRMYSLNNNRSPDDYPIKSIKVELRPEELERLKALSERPTLLTVVKSVWHQTAPLFCRPHLGATLLVCSTQFGLFTCFNGLSLWLPEVFNIMGTFSSSHPESYATACEIIGSAVEALTVSSDTSTSAMEGNASILLSVLTHEAVPMMVNRSAVSTSTEISGCDTSIDPSAFQNTLIVGVVATCVSFTGGYIVNNVGKKKFLCEFTLLVDIEWKGMTHSL
uniref:Major facilitator superfamily (MFS) profile domain-containing protein n=1 Tax=Timema monikensis TaxID=170555 RepID=A0A7R9EI82_9NEOP|nr:unnamed protein product [Timema monikensis]